MTKYHMRFFFEIFEESCARGGKCALLIIAGNHETFSGKYCKKDGLNCEKLTENAFFQVRTYVRLGVDLGEVRCRFTKGKSIQNYT